MKRVPEHVHQMLRVEVWLVPDDGYVGNIVHNSHYVNVAAGSNGTPVYVTCAEGEYGAAPNGDAEGYAATGGGFSIGAPDPGLLIAASHGLDSIEGDVQFSGKGWYHFVKNTTVSAKNVRVWVNCIYAPTSSPTDQALESGPTPKESSMGLPAKPPAEMGGGFAG